MKRPPHIDDELDEWIQEYLEARIGQMWGWWPPARRVKKRAQVGAFHRRCAHCQGVFLNSETEADHISPKVPVTGRSDETTWDEVIYSHLTAEENIQILCKPCHRKKSNAENNERRVHRKAKKGSGSEPQG